MDKKQGWNYKNSKIFAICTHHYHKIYIGGTISTRLVDVLNKYRYMYKEWVINGRKMNKKKLVYNILELGNTYIRLLGSHLLENKAELNDKIKYYKDIYKDDVLTVDDIVTKTIEYDNEEEKKKRKQIMKQIKEKQRLTDIIIMCQCNIELDFT